MELDLNRLDPELSAALEKMPSTLGLITRENLDKLRAGMAAQRASLPPSPFTPTRTVTITSSDGAEIDAHIYGSANGSTNGSASGDVAVPATLWIHGGGYILGSALDDRAGVIAERTGGITVSVEYRLAPEYPFPAGPEDCYAALQWLVANADELGVDRHRIALGGASAGGGMAAGVALMNRDRDNFPLALQLLLYPMIDNLHATPSGEFVNHPIWNRPTSFNAWEMYLAGTPGPAASPYAAASRATDLSGLPPAYICVGSEDLFRDEDIEYARRLSDANVPCELAVLPGMFHGGDGFVPHAKVSQRLNEGFLRALSDALS